MTAQPVSSVSKVSTSALSHCFTADALLATTAAISALLLLHSDIPHSFIHYTFKYCMFFSSLMLYM